MLTSFGSIAEVYIGLITACMPVMPAFYKHHFGSEHTTGYSHHQYSTDRTIEMMSTRRGGRRNTTISQKTQDCDSDENVLITDMLGPKTESSLRLSQRSETRLNSTERSPSPEATQITKTVEIKQTYE